MTRSAHAAKTIRTGAQYIVRGGGPRPLRSPKSRTIICSSMDKAKAAFDPRPSRPPRQSATNTRNSASMRWKVCRKALQLSDDTTPGRSHDMLPDDDCRRHDGGAADTIQYQGTCWQGASRRLRNNVHNRATKRWPRRRVRDIEMTDVEGQMADSPGGAHRPAMDPVVLPAISSDKSIGRRRWTLLPRHPDWPRPQEGYVHSGAGLQPGCSLRWSGRSSRTSSAAVMAAGQAVSAIHVFLLF